MFVFIRQHRQTGNRLVISVINSVVVDKHAFGKLSLFCALHFNMNVYPLFITIQHIHPDQLVNKTLTQLGILNDGLQLLIKKNMIL